MTRDARSPSANGFETELFRSTDARTWTNVAIPAELSVREIAGD